MNEYQEGSSNDMEIENLQVFILSMKFFLIHKFIGILCTFLPFFVIRKIHKNFKQLL